MTRIQLSKVLRFLENFIVSFKIGNRLPLELGIRVSHIFRVLRIVKIICKDLALGDYETNICEAVALLHDIGRFREYRGIVESGVCKTGHAEYSCEVFEEFFSEILDLKTYDIIHSVIRHHSSLKVPDDIGEQNEKISHIIRDSDKFDIMIFFRKSVKTGLINKKLNGFYMDKLDIGPPSNKIIDSIKKRIPVAYSNLRTISDVFMLQLGWIFEVKHQILLKLIIKENLILDACDYL